jgi:hypothetical protein
VTTVANKRAQRSGTTKKATRKQQARPKPAAATTKARPASGPAKPAARPSAPARQDTPLPLLEQARSLREAIQRSKLTAPDPWAYTPKARGWIQRADEVLARIESGADAAGTRKALEALQAEVEGDRDFQEARRLF